MKIKPVQGFGAVDVLLIVFVVLKLCGAIDWSWAVVLSPLWYIIGAAVGTIAALQETKKKNGDAPC